MPAKHIGQICKRCSILEAVLTVRNEALCRECFSKYVNTKVVKRMEAFRTRHAAAGEERKLLLPLSLGVSSVTLLHILHRHLQGQIERTGRTGFSLHVLFISLARENTTVSDEELKKLGLIKDRYPGHKYSTLLLDAIFQEHVSNPSSNGHSGHADIGPLEGRKPSEEQLEDLLTALPSSTSRSDIISILKTRLAVRFAQENSCEGILWGDSTTKLAEKVLAETAKGRGFSLPWQVTDGLSPHGILFFYPVRDVLKKELIAHADIISPPLSPLMDDDAFAPTQAPPSSKNTTIDILMKQYFESVEEHYPSIVSNVVRTTGKLQESKSGAQKCKLCQLPVDDALLGIHGWGGDQSIHEESDERDLGLCYGCARSIPREAVPLLP